MAITPFTIDVDQAILDDLRERLARTRWPEPVAGAGWDLGTDPAYLRELVAYWRDGFDWRAQEAALNRFAHFRAGVDGVGLHFIHERGQGPNPLPIVLTHGWPDSFYRMTKLLPLLTDPASYGGDPADSFDVVVPSLPGFGFSDQPRERGMNTKRVAALLASLMTDTLGYRRFAAHGGDVGSAVTEQLATDYADALVGIHLLDIPYMHLFTTPEEELTAAERDYLHAGQGWQMQEGAYAMVQGTKPQSLAVGLNDSPAGLAGWIVEKFRAWSDCDGDVERSFSKDELLTNITIYWATGTIGSSFRPYFEADGDSWEGAEAGDGDQGDGAAAWGATPQRIAVPTGVAIFPKDIVPAPREFGERFFNVQRWSEMPRGGHFAALEEPQLLAEELRAFFRPLRGA